MEEYKLMHALIESAVENGIRCMADNTKRGIRNLLDLGEYFAAGRFQKSFFDIAHEMLKNEDSFYYDKFEDLVKNTNHDAIANFGINIGYNSFTYGANIIREHEKESNYKIPWTVVFDFREEKEDHLTEDEILDIIAKGKRVGIYCYIILVDSNNILRDLYPIMNNNKDCAISLVISPKIITEQLVKDMSSITNLCLFILIDDTDEVKLQNSVNYLRKQKCLYGGCYYYDDKNFSYITEDETVSKKLVSMRANFAMMIQKTACTKEIAQNTYDYIYKSRFKTDSHTFMMDFYEDINRIGNIISEIPKETHFLCLDSIGQISLSSLENKTKYNIRTSSFEEILEITT